MTGPVTRATGNLEDGVIHGTSFQCRHDLQQLGCWLGIQLLGHVLSPGTVIGVRMIGISHFQSFNATIVF